MFKKIQRNFRTHPYWTCPHCGQSLGETVRGVKLPRQKARIFAWVRSCGDVGASTEDIINHCYDGAVVKNSVVKAHVYQINDMFAATDICVYSENRRWFVRGV